MRLLLSDFLNCPSTWCRIEGCHPPPIYDRYKRSGFLKIFCCKLIREVPREQFLQSNSWFMMLLSDYNNTVFKIDKKLRTLHDANQSLQNFRKWYSHMLLYFCCIVPFMIFLLGDVMILKYVSKSRWYLYYFLVHYALIN